MKQSAVYLNHLGMISALGDQPTLAAARLLRGDTDCLSFSAEFSRSGELPVGKVQAPLPSMDDFPVNERTRCNQLMLAAVNQLREHFDRLRQGVDPSRIAVVLGTSTSGIAEGEQALARGRQTDELIDESREHFDYRRQEMAAPAECLARWLNISGPAYVISTACSSSAKALASARRLLRSGLCDLVIAGGVDSLCGLTINGFGALESVSDSRCNPLSINRNGINIGEGAALFILSREPGPVALLGVGESSDAHHISAPDPSGAGAMRAMQQAIEDASVAREDISYVNLHGTATPQNDRMESLAVQQILGSDVACSSTKAYTGHTLGAAGAIEAAICWLTLQADSGLPVHIWDGKRDPEVADITLVAANNNSRRAEFALSNSFAFGGNNIALLLARAQL